MDAGETPELDGMEDPGIGIDALGTFHIRDWGGTGQGAWLVFAYTFIM